MNDKEVTYDTHLLTHFLGKMMTIYPDLQTVYAMIAVGRTIVIITDQFVYQATPSPQTEFVLRQICYIDK